MKSHYNLLKSVYTAFFPAKYFPNQKLYFQCIKGAISGNLTNSYVRPCSGLPWSMLDIAVIKKS